MKFVDRTFNANEKHANEIWHYLIEHDNGVTNIVLLYKAPHKQHLFYKQFHIFQHPFLSLNLLKVLKIQAETVLVPKRCQYCLSSIEQGIRFLSMERVKEDLQFFLDNHKNNEKRHNLHKAILQLNPNADECYHNFLFYEQLFLRFQNVLLL